MTDHEPPEDPIEVEIGDVLDLHPFQPSEVSSVGVELITGSPMADDRIHIGGSTIGLRLENGVELAVIEWKTADGKYQCQPAPGAWETGGFCP